MKSRRLKRPSLKIGDLVQIRVAPKIIGVITSISGQWCRVVWSDGCVGRYYDHNLKVVTEDLSKTDINCP